VAKNYYFENFENSMEQTLIEDLVIESIKIYGMDVWYIPRTLVAKDDILNEDDLSTFSEAHMVEMYVKSVDGFEGEGDFLSKFGLEIRDSITMTVARRTYDSEVGAYRTSNTRPMEGDLIYLPLNNKAFEIQHVEHESIFYQMGSLQMYDLRAELFEYSGERFRTGQKFIDELYKNFDTFVPTYEVQILDGYQFIIRDNSSSDTTYTAQALELKKGIEYTFDQSHISNRHLYSSPRLSFFNNGTSTEAEGVVTYSDKDGDGGYQGNGDQVYYPGYPGSCVKFTPQTSGTYQYKSLNGADGVTNNKMFYTNDINAGLDQGIWTKNNLDVTATGVASPRGTLDATTVTFLGNNAPTFTRLEQAMSSFPNPDGVIMSIYVKNADAGLKLEAFGQAFSGVVEEIDIPSSSEWQRIAVFANTKDIGNGQTSNQFTDSLPVFRISSIDNFVARSVTIWGAMTEFNAYSKIQATPYQQVVASFDPSGVAVTGKDTVVLDEQIDTLADNQAFEDFGQTDIGSDNIIDFSNSNPFGEDTF
jgi:hypothetical protein